MHSQLVLRGHSQPSTGLAQGPDSHGPCIMALSRVWAFWDPGEGRHWKQVCIILKTGFNSLTSATIRRPVNFRAGTHFFFSCLEACKEELKPVLIPFYAASRKACALIELRPSSGTRHRKKVHKLGQNIVLVVPSMFILFRDPCPPTMCKSPGKIWWLSGGRFDE